MSVALSSDQNVEEKVVCSIKQPTIQKAIDGLYQEIDIWLCSGGTMTNVDIGTISIERYNPRGVNVPLWYSACSVIKLKR